MNDGRLLDVPTTYISTTGHFISVENKTKQKTNNRQGYVELRFCVAV